MPRTLLTHPEWPISDGQVRFRPGHLARHMGMGNSGYRWLTDESEAASGDEIVFADEGERDDTAED